MKDDTFECGIPVQGNARFPISIKYLMTAKLFVLFDVEVVFFYPYAVNFREMGFEGFFRSPSFCCSLLYWLFVRMEERRFGVGKVA